MLLSEIFVIEAPIADFQFSGDPVTPYTFDANDLKAVRNPKWHAKLLKTFEKTSAPINIYLMNPDKSFFHNTTASYRTEKEPVKIDPKLTLIREIAGMYEISDFKRNFGFEPRDYASSISFIFTNNYGDDKIAITPWILAHRAIHAMSSSQTGTGRSTIKTQQYFSAFARTIRGIVEGYRPRDYGERNWEKIYRRL